MIWHYRIDSAADGETNMRLDLDFYRNFNAHSIPLLRFYRWLEPTLSVGRYQRLGFDISERCQDMSIPIVRRPTGGQAILHTGDLCISLTAPTAINQSLIQHHHTISRAYIFALEKLGLKASLGFEEKKYAHQTDCFATITPADIQIAGRKIMGSAQVRCRKAYLQQSVIYLQSNADLHKQLFQQDNPIGGLHHLMQTVPSEQAMIQAILAGFETVYGVRFAQV